MYFCFGFKCITNSAYFTACPQQLWHMCLLIKSKLYFPSQFSYVLWQCSLFLLLIRCTFWATDQWMVISCSAAHTHVKTLNWWRPESMSEINILRRTALCMGEGHTGGCSVYSKCLCVNVMWWRAAWTIQYGFNAPQQLFYVVQKTFRCSFYVLWGLTGKLCFVIHHIVFPMVAFCRGGPPQQKKNK